MDVRLRVPRPKADPVTEAVGRRAVSSSPAMCDWSGIEERVHHYRSRLLPIVARRAFEHRAVTLSSGRQSDYYVDGKQVTLWPEGALLFARIILEALRDQPVDTIGGLTIGADPIVGAVVALGALEGRHIPGFIVRKDPKPHGKMALIEGELKPGARAVVVDDVITTGTSILKAIREVESQSAFVVGVLALTDREEGGRAALEQGGYPTFAVFTKTELAEARACR